MRRVKPQDLMPQIINEVYDGPGKRYLSLLPTVLFAGIVPQVLALWQQTAQSLTVAENHALESVRHAFRLRRG